MRISYKPYSQFRHREDRDVGEWQPSPGDHEIPVTIRVSDIGKEFADRGGSRVSHVPVTPRFDGKASPVTDVIGASISLASFRFRLSKTVTVGGFFSPS
jgi:hypothetical protein